MYRYEMDVNVYVSSIYTETHGTISTKLNAYMI